MDGMDGVDVDGGRRRTPTRHYCTISDLGVLGGGTVRGGGEGEGAEDGRHGGATPWVPCEPAERRVGRTGQRSAGTPNQLQLLHARTQHDRSPGSP
jgi:hypothetical protein